MGRGIGGGRQCAPPSVPPLPSITTSPHPITTFTFVPFAFVPFILTFAFPSAAQQAAPVTFTREIAPILLSHCAACHRQGAAAPFSLLTYDDARRHATQIAAATKSRYMPPWKPEAGFGDFADARRLSDHDI